MSAIQSDVVFPKFCGGRRFSRGRIHWHKCEKIFYRIFEEPLDSCFGCMNLNFLMGKDVVANSGFCVANGIVALAAKVFYSISLLKKRRYFL